MNDECNKLAYEDTDANDKYIRVDICSVANEIHHKLLK